MADPSSGLVRDYLSYRGFHQTTRVFDVETKTAADSVNSVDKTVEEMLSCVQSHDIERLKTIWQHFNTNVFNSLTGEQSRLAEQYETDIYRLYLVKCVESRQQTRCVEFFQKMSSHIVNNPQWNEWFSFPYVSNPQEMECYRKYFSKQWVDIFVISLHNFIAIAQQAASPPWLVQMLREVNQVENSSPAVNEISPFDDDLMDDFAVIAQCSGPLQSTSSKPSLKSLLKNITGKRSSD